MGNIVSLLEQPKNLTLLLGLLVIFRKSKWVQAALLTAAVVASPYLQQRLEEGKNKVTAAASHVVAKKKEDAEQLIRIAQKLTNEKRKEVIEATERIKEQLEEGIEDVNTMLIFKKRRSAKRIIPGAFATVERRRKDRKTCFFKYFRLPQNEQEATSYSAKELCLILNTAQKKLKYRPQNLAAFLSNEGVEPSIIGSQKCYQLTRILPWSHYLWPPIKFLGKRVFKYLFFSLAAYGAYAFFFGRHNVLRGEGGRGGNEAFAQQTASPLAREDQQSVAADSADDDLSESCFMPAIAGMKQRPCISKPYILNILGRTIGVPDPHIPRFVIAIQQLECGVQDGSCDPRTIDLFIQERGNILLPGEETRRCSGHNKLDTLEGRLRALDRQGRIHDRQQAKIDAMRQAREARREDRANRLEKQQKQSG
jgi:hypothetical protein